MGFWDGYANDRDTVLAMQADRDLSDLRKQLYRAIVRYRYTYNFQWMGRPIIQLPEDMVTVQEILWRVKPQLVIETGVAHGGSLVYSASLLEAMGTDGHVVGVDIDIRDHNRRAIEAHPMKKRISLIQGSSVSEEVMGEVREKARGKSPVLVMLDSNHTHEHVAQELELYSPLVTQGSYLIVFDTLIEDLDDDLFGDRPWGKGNNPKTAVMEFLKKNDRFEVDRDVEGKMLFSVAPMGYLRCVK